jgi:hypothetical protein
LINLHVTSERYKFSQRFDVSALKAYEWCTSYDPGDLELMGESGTRVIERIADDTIILSDTFSKDGQMFTKEKLVRLYPERMSWVSTHISGAAKYSQFLYEIQPLKKSSSKIDFTGLQIDYSEAQPTKKEIAVRAAQLKKEDSAAWKRLSKAMQKDLRK